MAPSTFPAFFRAASRRARRRTADLIPLSLFLAVALSQTALPPAAAAQSGQISAILEKLKMVEEDGRKVAQVTMKDILALALERSNILKVSKIGQQIAASRLAVAKERNSPSLESNVEHGRSIVPFSSTFSGTSFLRLSSTDETTLSAALSKKGTTGITYGLTYRESRSGSETLEIPSEGDSPQLDTTTTSRTISSSSLIGSMNIPIFQDYGHELDEVPVRQGEIGVTRSRFESRRGALLILRTIALVYWDLVDTREQVKVAQESVRLSERLVRENEQRLKAGVLSPAEVAVSEAQLARERQNLLEAQLVQLRIEDQVRAALNLEEIDIGYRPIERPTLRETDFDFKTLLEKMYRSNPDLGILAANMESNSYDLLEARNNDETDLDLDLFYVFNGYDSSPMGGVSGFGETDLGGYGASLTWTVPLFDHTAQEEIQQRVLERSQIELRVSEERSNLSVELQSVLRSLRLARKEVETARIAQSLADQLLRNEIERFKLGRSTSFRVAQFQRDAAEAHRREIQARVRYEKAFLDMLVLTGDIFEFYGLPETS
jgi:outer membrane protein TolC